MSVVIFKFLIEKIIEAILFFNERFPTLHNPTLYV